MNPLERIRSAARSVRDAIPDQRLWSTAEVRAGERYLEEGRYEEAEQCLSRLLEELDANESVRPHHGHLLVCLISAHIGRGNLVSARIVAERAIQLLSDPRLRLSTDLPAAQALLGRVELQEGNEDASEMLLRQALETQEAVRPLDVPAVAMRAVELAELLQYREQPEEALAFLQSAVERAEAALGEEHAVTARCLLELGQCHSRCSQHAEAQASLQRALRVHQTLYGNDAEEVVSILKLLAEAAQRAGDFEAAAGHYERALSLRERRLGASTRESVEILMNLAGVESEMGHFGRAAERLQQAIGKAEVEHLTHLPKALEKLAVVYMLSGRLSDAGVSLARARQMYDANPGRYRMEILANEEIYTQLRSYYHVETPAAPPPPAQEAVREIPAQVYPVVEEVGHRPVFEVFDEEPKPVRPLPTVRPAPSPDTNAIAALANMLSTEHALSADAGRHHVWVPAQEWQRVLSALRTIDTPAGAERQEAPEEPPAPKGTLPLWGWDDVGFEYTHV
ncbi:MAG: tetratricopeptide repeat protein [Bryobacterales bacterium]|nr:tetratricopeptide repeat protein [Bryobacterales bacterium]